MWTFMQLYRTAMDFPYKNYGQLWAISLVINKKTLQTHPPPLLLDLAHPLLNVVTTGTKSTYCPVAFKHNVITHSQEQQHNQCHNECHHIQGKSFECALMCADVAKNYFPFSTLKSPIESLTSVSATNISGFLDIA